MNGDATVEDRPGLDPEALGRTLTGFEQIAIRQMFRERVDQLAHDGMMFYRALLFVVEKRAGMGDADAFKKVMNLPLEDVLARFPDVQSVDAEQDGEAQAALDAQYAEFVVGVGLSFMPDQFLALTLGQRAALIEAANRKNGA